MEQIDEAAVKKVCREAMEKAFTDTGLDAMKGCSIAHGGDIHQLSEGSMVVAGYFDYQEGEGEDAPRVSVPVMVNAEALHLLPSRARSAALNLVRHLGKPLEG
jgi:hypothetical protein